MKNAVVFARPMSPFCSYSLLLLIEWRLVYCMVKNVWSIGPDPSDGRLVGRSVGITLTQYCEMRIKYSVNENRWASYCKRTLGALASIENSNYLLDFTSIENQRRIEAATVCQDSMRFNDLFSMSL